MPRVTVTAVATKLLESVMADGDRTVRNTSATDTLDVDKTNAVTSGGGLSIPPGGEEHVNMEMGDQLWGIAPATKSIVAEVI